MKFLNALVAALSLITLYKILKISNTRVYRNLVLTVFAGSSYGVIRFATEAECYTFPLFFALTGSYIFTTLPHSQKPRISVLLISLFLSVACLFHQLYFFWWLGIFISTLCKSISTKSLKVNIIISYLVPALIVPICYLLVFIYYEEKQLTISALFQYIFTEYYSGNVHHSFGIMNFLLLGINFLRTFFQIHGNIFYIISRFPVLTIVAVACLTTIGYALYTAKGRYSLLVFPYLARTHAFIAIVYVLFAIYANGNAEFMSMLPFLFCIVFASSSFNYVKLLLFSLAMLLWNLSMSVIPDNIIDYNNSRVMIELLKNDTSKNYFLKNGLTLMNNYFYLFGYYPPNLVVKSYDKTLTAIQMKIEADKVCITDYGNNVQAISRAYLLDKNAQLLDGFSLSIYDSVPTFYGYNRLYKISKKKASDNL